jgi:hypothetical protein
LLSFFAGCSAGGVSFDERILPHIRFSVKYLVRKADMSYNAPKATELKRSIVMVEVQQNGKTYVDLASLALKTEYNYEYLRKIAKAGKVDSIKIGASWMMNPEDLDRYRDERKNRGPHSD